MYFSQLLLKWLNPFFDQNHMLDYSCVVCFQIIVCPCKHIFLLFEKVEKCLPLLQCATRTEIRKLQILFHSQVDMFMRHGGTMGFYVPWPLKVVLQVIEHFERYHTLGYEVAFLVISYGLQRLIVLIFVNRCILEEINISHEVQYLLIILKYAQISYVITDKRLIQNFNSKPIPKWCHPSICVS